MPVAEIPTLPILVPTTAVAIVVALGWLHRWERLTPLRAMVGVVLCVYGAGVLGHVLLPVVIVTDDARPWRVWLHLTPFTDVVADPAGMLLNVALFVPLGVLLPLVGRVRSAGQAAAVGLLVSLAIELVQLVGALTVVPGRIADVDDLIGNTLGTVVGYGVLRLAARTPGLSGLVARATWTAPAAVPGAGG